LDIHNAHPGHIGLQTTDVNIDHTQWPCVSHEPSLRCEDAVRQAARRPFRALVPAPKLVPRHDFIPPGHS
jgi:hypothetical protein